MPEQSKLEKKPEPKRSVTENIKFPPEESRNRPEQKYPQNTEYRKIRNGKALSGFPVKMSSAFFVSRRDEARKADESRRR